jgi:hypothetical protein
VHVIVRNAPEKIVHCANLTGSAHNRRHICLDGPLMSRAERLDRAGVGGCFRGVRHPARDSWKKVCQRALPSIFLSDTPRNASTTWAPRSEAFFSTCYARRELKNACNSAVDSAPSTPSIISTRWFSSGESAI